MYPGASDDLEQLGPDIPRKQQRASSNGAQSGNCCNNYPVCGGWWQAGPRIPTGLMSLDIWCYEFIIDWCRCKKSTQKLCRLIVIVVNRRASAGIGDCKRRGPALCILAGKWREEQIQSDNLSGAVSIPCNYMRVHDDAFVKSGSCHAAVREHGRKRHSRRWRWQTAQHDSTVTAATEYVVACRADSDATLSIVNKSWA